MYRLGVCGSVHSNCQFFIAYVEPTVEGDDSATDLSPDDAESPESEGIVFPCSPVHTFIVKQKKHPSNNHTPFLV